MPYFISKPNIEQGKNRVERAMDMLLFLQYKNMMLSRSRTEWPKILFGCIFATGVFCLDQSQILAAQKEDSKQLPDSSETHVAAQIYNTKINYDDVLPDSRQIGLKKRRLNAQQFSTWMTDYQRERITSLIIGPIFQNYAKAQKLGPQAAEVQAFVYAMHQDRKQNLIRWRRQKSDLQDRLKERGLPPAEEEKFKASIAQLEKKIDKTYRVEQQQELNTDQAVSTEKNIAEEAVRNWKLNRSLYSRYGGGIIAKQTGPEPIDAYRSFLEEHEKQGTFIIFDPHLRQLFWDYFVNDRSHTFYPQEEVKQIFDQPSWERVSKP